MEKRGIEKISGFQIKPQSKDLDHQDLIKQLYEQIEQLTVERDWLKKGSVASMHHVQVFTLKP